MEPLITDSLFFCEFVFWNTFICIFAHPAAVSSPMHAWLEKILPFLASKTCMCYFFLMLPTSCIIRKSDQSSLVHLHPAWDGIDISANSPQANFFSYLKNPSYLILTLFIRFLGALVKAYLVLSVWKKRWLGYMTMVYKTREVQMQALF